MSRLFGEPEDSVRLRKRRRLALESADGPALPAELFFRGLSAGQTRLFRERYVATVGPNVVGKRLAEDEYLILAASTAVPEGALALYRKHWEIETLFAALKTRGFDVETTHLTRPERGTTQPGVRLEPSDEPAARTAVTRKEFRSILPVSVTLGLG